MEINLNSDLGEKSKHHSGVNDSLLLDIVNTANIACGYHAGSSKTMHKTIKDAKIKDVSIGAHPGFNDRKNFGRKRINLSKNELKKLIREQLELFKKISILENYPFTHVKPHGALNNMACENLEISLIIGNEIKEFNKELIFVVLPLSKMEIAAQKNNLKYACEIFCDRNYEDDGSLMSRDKKNALIYDPKACANNTLEMIESSSIKCFSGKKIYCSSIDTVCVHGDSKSSILIAKELQKIIKMNNIPTKKLNELKKFI
jgi:UPF0271 protein